MKPLRWYFWPVGALDAATGLLLVAAPLFTLRLMRIPTMPREPVLLRFVGAFVLAVGLAYLYPWLMPAGGRPERLRTVLEVTTLERLAVGGFVAVAVGVGALGGRWLTVAFTDLCLAGAQALVLARWSR